MPYQGAGQNCIISGPTQYLLIQNPIFITPLGDSQAHQRGTDPRSQPSFFTELAQQGYLCFRNAHIHKELEFILGTSGRGEIMLPVTFRFCPRNLQNKILNTKMITKIFPFIYFCKQALNGIDFSNFLLLTSVSLYIKWVSYKQLDLVFFLMI